MVSLNNCAALCECVAGAIEYRTVLDESAVLEVIGTTIKKVLIKLRDIALGIYRKVKSFCQTAKDKISQFGRKIKSDISHRNNPPAAPATPWDKMVIDEVRRRAATEDYGMYFELYQWDSRYIDSLPAKMEQFDNLRMRVNGKYVSINPGSLVRILQDALTDNEFDRGILKRYTEDVESEFSRVFQTESEKPSEDEILYRAGQTEKLHINIDVHVVEDMIKTIETMPDVVHNIGLQYKDLAASYKAAERVVDSIRAGGVLYGDANMFVNMIQSIITSKNFVFNTVQSAHLRIVRDRAREYMDTLIEYVNS